MKHPLHFLKSQKLLILASSDNDQPWVANVYFVVDDDCKLYFVSREGARHSQEMLMNPKVAFSSVWFDTTNFRNRKAVQGVGTCNVVEDEAGIMKALQLYHSNFLGSDKLITLEWLRNNEHQSCFWVIEPTYLKHWDDEQYGEDGSKEFYW